MTDTTQPGFAADQKEEVWNGNGKAPWDRVNKLTGHTNPTFDTTDPVAPAQPAQAGMAPLYGIIDPDYARVFTVARCIAWSEGYAMLMHGSFTRDLDLLAVPWAEQATDAEHLIRRIATALDDLDILVKDPKAPSQSSEKPHGRRSWTMTFKSFGDPRFVDIGVMPLVNMESFSPSEYSLSEQIREHTKLIYKHGSMSSRDALFNIANQLDALLQAPGGSR